jgi:hypothetical protein
LRTMAVGHLRSAIINYKIKNWITLHNNKLLITRQLINKKTTSRSSKTTISRSSPRTRRTHRLELSGEAIATNRTWTSLTSLASFYLGQLRKIIQAGDQLNVSVSTSTIDKNSWVLHRGITPSNISRIQGSLA